MINAAVTLPPASHLRALIGPHAGYRFSGPTAGHAYKNIDPALYDRVFLLGPSHKVAFDFVAVSGCTEWDTPLGLIKIDTGTVKSLVDDKVFGQIEKRFEENEHSLEMHIPFIRHVFAEKEIKMVPLMVG